MKIKTILVFCLILIVFGLMIGCTVENKNSNPAANAANTNVVNNNQQQSNTNAQTQNDASQNANSGSEVSNQDSNAVPDANIEEQTESKETQTIETAASDENSAHLILQSTPMDAEVYANGNLVGKTPLDVYLPAVFTKVEVKKYGYVDYVLPIAFNPKDSKSISAKLILDVGFINIGTNPKYAMIYINGKYKGKSPLIINVSYGQIANVTLKLTGYQDYSEQINIDEPKKTHFISKDLVATN